MLGHLILSQHLMEPESSIANSQELSICSYPEPDLKNQSRSEVLFFVTKLFFTVKDC
jgi:hypothetical protein